MDTRGDGGAGGRGLGVLAGVSRRQLWAVWGAGACNFHLRGGATRVRARVVGDAEGAGIGLPDSISFACRLRQNGAGVTVKTFSSQSRGQVPPRDAW